MQIPRAAPHNSAGLGALFQPEAGDRLRAESLGEYLDNFVDGLLAAGYCSLTIRQYIGPVVHLGVWLARPGLRVESLGAGDVVARFERHLRRCHCRRRSRVQRCGRSKIVMVAVRRFIGHLRDRGVVAAEAKPVRPRIVEEFDRWMQQHRGSADRTLADYRPLVISFVESRRGRRWQHLNAKTVRTYVIEQCKKLTQSRRLVLVRALRMFMRFLVATSRCRSHLDRSVPSMPHWRLATLPRYLDEDVVERIVASRPTTTSMGLRDRAVLLLLARLALRAGDVRGLCLSDLDWERGQLRVVGKLRRPSWLPMSQEVGDAILAYLRVRPACQHQEVFLCMNAPHRSLGATTVSGICRRAIDEIGVTCPSKGAHVFRHSAATALVRHGASLDDVGRLLRHASRESTAVYAKVSVGSLRRIAQPWPEAA